MNRKKEISEILAYAFIILGFLFALSSALLFLYKKNIDFALEIDHELFANFGDLLSGTVGALWALSGVLLFVTALKLQRKDFENQLEEIKVQNRNMLLQSYETKFYNLIRYNYDHINRVHRYQSHHQSHIPISGWTILRQFHEYLLKKINDQINQNPEDEILGSIKSIYKEKYFEEPDFSFIKTYFSTIFIILTNIDSNTFLSKDEKQEYADILHAQLTPEELCLIFYHCLTNFDHEELKSLVVKYSIIRSLCKRRVPGKLKPFLKDYITETQVNTCNTRI